MVDDAAHDFEGPAGGMMPNQLSTLLTAVADKEHAWTSEGMKRDPRWSRGNDMDLDPTQDEAISDPLLIRTNKEPVILTATVTALQSLENTSQHRPACNSNKSCSPSCSDDGDATTTTETSSDVEHHHSCSASCADDEDTTTATETSSDVDHRHEDPICNSNMKLALQASRDFEKAAKIALGNSSKKRVYTYRKRREAKNKKEVIARPHHTYVLIFLVLITFTPVLM